MMRQSRNYDASHTTAKDLQESNGNEKGTEEQRWHTHLRLPLALVLICQLSNNYK